LISITFLPENLTVSASRGESIIDIARRAGVGLKADCGGKGKCGTCKVLFEVSTVPEGALSEVSPDEKKLLPESRDGETYRLACLSRVYENLTITIPKESQVSRISPRKPVTIYKIPIHPAIERVPFRLDEKEERAPTRSLRHRIQNTLHKVRPEKIRTPGLDVLAEFSRNMALKRVKEMTATIFKGHEIIQLRFGTEEALYGMAVDLGTTSLGAFLCDLANDRIMATASLLNPQVTYGEDVISRIAHVQKRPADLINLQEVLIEGVNHLIQKTCKKAGISKDDVLDMVAVGNPTMQHLFLGLNPISLGEAPYLPLCFEGGEVRAHDLRVDIFPLAKIHLLPMLSGFIGGDTLAAMLTRESHAFTGCSLMVDVGTNGELVLAVKGNLTATSCATGPVFEGAQITCGMRATPGAIDKIWVDENTAEIRYHVIGGPDGDASARAAGICGSGVISAVSALTQTDIIKEDGAFDVDRGHPSLRAGKRSGRPEIVIAPAVDSRDGMDIVFTQEDIRAVQLGKAALRAGVEILMKDAGVDALDRVFLAGTFGSYLDPREVLNIGMLPPVELDQVESIGNAAGDGARLALFSVDKRRQALDLAQQIKVVELSMRPDFQEVFIDSMHF
jgi:uncharacterized 2Fe-2S/4Fe-4S cluster protein (DUF4445 family)